MDARLLSISDCPAKMACQLAPCEGWRHCNHCRQRFEERKLGKGTAADASLRDGFVRNVEVQCKNLDSTTFSTVQRPVQKLIVLVAVDSDDE